MATSRRGAVRGRTRPAAGMKEVTTPSARLLLVACAMMALNCLPKTAAGAETNRAGTSLNPTNDPKAYAAMPGPALVQKLLEAETRSQAFYELCRRGGVARSADYASFLEDHYDPEVVVCPQGGGQASIYAVLYGFLDRTPIARDEDYETPSPAELFPPTDRRNAPRRWDEPAIEAFAADGRRLEPFGGGNMLAKEGVMADINCDGLVERADVISYMIDPDTSVSALEVAVMRPVAKPILAVLLNWGEYAWAYRLAEPDKDGIRDLEIGPKTAAGVVPKVRYRWNKDKKVYEGPAGREGDHFRLLDVSKTDTFEALERLKTARPKFPKDPDFVDVRLRDEGPWARRGRKKPSAQEVSKPYRRASLQNLPPEEIVRYMGDGKCISELEWETILKTHAPTNFWTLDPKSAALALADANRYPDHRKHYRLAVDDRDGAKPPDTGSLAFSDASARCYNAIDSHYFLRVAPEKSYVAYAQLWAGGAVFYDFVHDQPAFDFRFCELPYEEARHLAQTIWWLNRVRSLCDSASDDGSEVSSSADARGRLTFRGGGGDVALRFTQTLWADQVSERWRRNYNRETCLNLAAYLLVNALPERLGDRWSRFEPKHAQDILSRPAGAPQYEQEERRHILDTAETFLGLFSPDQASISFAIVSDAACAAGTFACTNLAARLEGIQPRVPAVPDTKRAQEAIEAEMARLDKVGPNTAGWKAAMKKNDSLSRELMALRFDADADDIRVLSGSLAVAMKELSCADDLQALQDWAASEEPAFQWALQRLKEKDRKRYIAALEWWMQHTKDKWVRQAFDAIAREDSPRAVEIARQTRADQTGNLAVSAFAHLAEVDGIPDEPKRVRTLLQVALEPKSGWEERSRALELLVPKEQPLRYPTRDIDEALVKLLRPEMADELINFTLGCACQALARRGRTEYFATIEKALQTTQDGDIYGEALDALTRLAQSDPPRFNPRLLAILRPQLKRTDKKATDLMMAAWAADLRELKPELESLATSGPDDYEDERSHSYGGDVRPFEGRFHLARQIVALWNEDDPATRCRLLLAFGLGGERDFVDEPRPAQRARMKAELEKAAHSLTPEQREAAGAFLAWYRREHIDPEKEPYPRERRAKFVAWAKSQMGLP